MKTVQNNCESASINLDVCFTKQCDNNCSFCIEKTHFSSLDKPNVINLIEYTISSKIKNIYIIGGESFLFPNELYNYINGIRKFVDIISISSSIPSTFHKNKQICDDIINLIDMLNITIQHPNWLTNNKLLNSPINYNKLEILKKLNKKYPNKIITTINLSKGGIDTKNMLMKTLIHLEEIGCKSIKINELRNSDKYVSYEKIMGIKMKSPFVYGCNNNIDIKGIKSKLILQRSCFLTEETKPITIIELIKYLIKSNIKVNDRCNNNCC